MTTTVRTYVAADLVPLLDTVAGHYRAYAKQFKTMADDAAKLARDICERLDHADGLDITDEERSFVGKPTDEQLAQAIEISLLLSSGMVPNFDFGHAETEHHDELWTVASVVSGTVEPYKDGYYTREQIEEMKLREELDSIER